MNLETLGISKDELLDLAATKLADQFADEENLSDRVRKLIEKRIDTEFSTNVTRRIDDFLSAQMETILAKEICPVDIFGESTGSPTTIQAKLAERAKTFWEEKVDEQGRVTGGYNTTPRHERLFSKIVNEEFTRAVKQNIVNLVGSFKDALSESANKITKEHIDSLIKVKSLGDRQ